MASKKEWATLMRDLDPFETHTPQRKYNVWTWELGELEQIVERARTDANALSHERAQSCGGRLVDVRNRIKHIKSKLNTSAMRFEHKCRERRSA